MINKQKSFVLILFALLLSLCNKSFAEDISLLPKYGDKTKTAQQLAYDKQFIQGKSYFIKNINY